MKKEKLREPPWGEKNQEGVNEEEKRKSQSKENREEFLR